MSHGSSTYLRLFFSTGILLLFLVFHSCEHFEPKPLLLVGTDDVREVRAEEVHMEGLIIHVGEGDIIQHGFCWSESPEPSVNLDTKIELGGRTDAGSFDEVIPGLEHSTTYHIKAYATDEEGSVYGDSKTFTTLAITGPELSTLPVQEITQNTAKSGGDISFNGGSEILAKGVCWSTSQDPTLLDRITEEGEGEGVFESTLSGLECGTTYFIRAYATNKVTTAYGQQLEFTTGICLTRPEVITAPVSDITDKEAISGGEVKHDGHSPILARGVCWSTSPGPTVDNNKTQDGSEVGPFESQITDLSPRTTYYLRAYATNSEGTGYGEERSFVTWDGSVTDIDGNIYQSVLIGDQEWMKANLRVTHYPNGVPIPMVSSPAEWDQLAVDEAAFCWYDNDDSQQELYGALYNWSAAMNGAAASDRIPSGVQGVCPDSWHLPSDAEWKQLEIHLGINPQDADLELWRGILEGGKMKSTTEDWNEPNTAATNESGFSGIPAGYRQRSGTFSDIGCYAVYWSTTEFDPDRGWHRNLLCDQGGIYRFYYDKRGAFSVRCLKD